MKLSEWMDEKELTQEQAEAVLGIDQTTISRILAGRSCSMLTVGKIVKATEGSVEANDLVVIVD